jgi:ATP phosphoribosyltransferase
VQVKIALPKGRLLAETAALLREADWGLSGYHEGMHSYYLKSSRFHNLSARVFHERDIPIQVAVGNYDLGICGLDWVEELMAKYPTSALVKVKNLGYGESTLYIAASDSEAALSPEEMQANKNVIRIASEYPNLAESFALNRRLRRFSIFPLWGAAEAYPPENADLVLVAGRGDDGLSAYNLTPMSSTLSFSAFLIANKTSWETKDTSNMLAALNNKLPITEKRPPPTGAARRPKTATRPASGEAAKDTIRLALPDGHQQIPTLELLNKAGIKIDDYPSTGVNYRPTTSLNGVISKVIRPQDMPLQVANGNFDLAITGRDWLKEHLYQFPSSPATELLDLKFGGVKIVAVVSNDVPVTDVYGLRQLSAERTVPFRVASEYVNIADKYARDSHLGMYRVIPTWGASEAFVPEDADLLIENTQTGRTIARHNLKIIDTLFKSTACLIGARDSEYSPVKSKRIKSIIEALQIAVENT